MPDNIKKSARKFGILAEQRERKPYVIIVTKDRNKILKISETIEHKLWQEI